MEGIRSDDLTHEIVYGHQNNKSVSMGSSVLIFLLKCLKQWFGHDPNENPKGFIAINEP